MVLANLVPTCRWLGEQSLLVELSQLAEGAFGG